MKSKLFILPAIIAASLVATSAYSQVFVNAHVGFRVPGAHVYVGAAPAPVVYENDYPGYAYYDYPAWNGHYRDQFYYAHYRPYFERDHRAYFNGGRFDHGRFDHDRGYRGGYNGGGYHGGGYHGRR